MPKSNKKKKDKAADFAKAKLKLGKGKQAPSNVVDTAFKARSIALPTQSIAIEKDADAPSTKRRLTFDALINHMKHYNATTRRDAILGLRELLEAHRELILAQLTPLINGCVRLVSDEDASVRRTLWSFFSWLFRQVPRDDLVPHTPVLLLFTTSAQTHIFPEIRIDAVRFLDIYLEYIPEIVTEGWMQPGSGSHGRRVMEGYLGILNAGTTFGEGGDVGPVLATSTASVVLSPASKLIVLKSLESFLSRAVASSWSSKDGSELSSSVLVTPTWYLSSSFASTSAFGAFDALLQPSSFRCGADPLRLGDTRVWLPEVSENGGESFVGQFSLLSESCSSAWSFHDLTDVDAAVALLREGQAGSGTDVEITCVAHLARTLHPTLVSTFLDCAPTVFSPSANPPETELQMVIVFCRICRSLYGRLLQDSAESGTSHEAAEAELHTILSYLSPYFPFAVNAPNARRDIKIEQAFQDLNLIYCELSSFLVLASQRDTPPQGSSRKNFRFGRNGRVAPSVPTSTTQARQIERVSVYITQLLRGQASTSSSQITLPRPITPQAYIALLPTIWSLVNSRHSDIAEPTDSVFSVVAEHAIKASSTSAVKRHTIDFIGRLLLLDGEREYIGTFKVGNSPEQDLKLEQWILHLPKTLWELGGNNPATTETIVRLLLRLTQRRSRLLQPSTYSALRSRLIPYFSIAHPTRGKIPGPYAKLPSKSPVRRLVLDLVATLVGQGNRASSTDDGLAAAVSEAVQDSPESSYWEGC
ncbi:hypothetical protein BD311DRAFT_746356 [Dichomitus squalens]|uniref:Pre-rRNA-processing protein n=1 Tax=Dichomitus squalens TaxID=114155 RepID=A0A4Q9N5I9_9APHY|nr:hypothetical protein BD311DRAFT_746356 [Dichomitus squalens]